MSLHGLGSTWGRNVHGVPANRKTLELRKEVVKRMIID